MGYWTQSEEGHSFTEADSGEHMIWGDQPADIVDHAIWQIKAVFVKDVGRLPTRKELMAGLTFSTAVLDGLPETVAEAEEKADAVLGLDWVDDTPYPQMVSERGREYERDYYRATDSQAYDADGEPVYSVEDRKRRENVAAATIRISAVIESLTPEKSD